MVLDLIVIALFILFIVIGAVRGAARSLFGLVSSFAAYLVGTWLAGLASTGLYDLFVRPTVNGIIEDWIGKLADGTVAEAKEAIPAWLYSAMKLSGCKLDNIGEFTSSASQKIAADVNSAVQPIIVGFVSVILTVLLFLVFSFILNKILKEPVLALFHVSIVGKVDRVLGAVIGAVESFLVVSMLGYLLRLLLPHIAEPPAFMDESTIYNSLIFYHFYSGNIFTMLASWVFKG